MAKSQCNKYKGDKVKVILVLCIRVMLLALGETMQEDMQGLLNATTVKVKGIWLDNALSLSDQGMQHVITRKQYLEVPDGQAVQTIIPNNTAFQTEDFDFMILIVMISRMHKRFSWPTFPTMVLTSYQRYLILKPILMIW
ncbi:hypothetical protein Tco_0129013 [Tanacetum coccineum]